MLGMHVRTFQRWAARYEDEGEAGLVDRRMGRRSPRRAPEEELERMLGLFRDKYADFTVKHFHEQLEKRHGYKLGYTVTKLTLARGRSGAEGARSVSAIARSASAAAAGHDAASGRLAPRLDRRSAADGPDRDARGCDERDLLDDPGRGGRHRLDVPRLARGDRGARPVLRALHRPRQPIISTPRRAASGHRGRTRRRSAAPWRSSASSTSPPTRPRRSGPFGARLPHPAGSPAQGAAACRHRRRRGRQPVAARTLHRRIQQDASRSRRSRRGPPSCADRTEAWREILCVIEERTVGNDNTIAWAKQRLQLPESRLRPHFVKARVQVHEYPDASVSVFLGPHRLASYDGRRRAAPSPDARQPGSVLDRVKGWPA